MPAAGGQAARSTRKVRGVTLLELMFTLGLLGVLLGLALPAYSNYRQRAKTAQAVKDIAAISASIQLYYQNARGFPPDLPAVSGASPQDPWGQPYNYYNIDANGKGGARKDKKLNPLNSDFDLYSMGPDGKSKTQISNQDSIDDVIRASDGAFIGVADNF